MMKRFNENLMHYTIWTLVLAPCVLVVCVALYNATAGFGE